MYNYDYDDYGSDEQEVLVDEYLSIDHEDDVDQDDLVYEIDIAHIVDEDE